MRTPAQLAEQGYTEVEIEHMMALTDRAIRLLRENEPEDGKNYQGAFSGGKDSIVIKALAALAGVSVDWHYNFTTIDPPELVQFIKRVHPDVQWNISPKGHLLQYAGGTATKTGKGWPTFERRWCCEVYKESKPAPGTTEILGVRVAESPRRKKQWATCTVPRYIVKGGEHIAVEGTKIVLPVRLWDDRDIWAFIAWQELPYCSLYDEGFDRLGCVGCPMLEPHQRATQFKRWPAFERQWKNLFMRLWAYRAGKLDRNKNEWFGSRHFDSWEELYAWWNDRTPNVRKWREAHGLRIKPGTEEN